MYKRQIRRYYAGHGVELDMSEIFISDGAKSDLGNLLDLFSQDNTILVPDPVYPVYVDDNVMAGRKILYLPATAENGFLPMPDEAPHADIVYICSPNNPTGATYSLSLIHILPAHGRRGEGGGLYPDRRAVHDGRRDREGPRGALQSAGRQH